MAGKDVRGHTALSPTRTAPLTISSRNSATEQGERTLMRHPLLHGMAAGAAGTTALNTATYLDMALRGRPSSTTPEQTVRRAEDLTGKALSPSGKEAEPASNRRSGLGALLGIVTGVGAGMFYGVVRSRWPQAPLVPMSLVAATAANAGSVAPMSALGVTDPRQWPASSWVMDLLPHLAYGCVTAAVYEQLTKSGNPAKNRII